MRFLGLGLLIDLWLRDSGLSSLVFLGGLLLLNWLRMLLGGVVGLIMLLGWLLRGQLRAKWQVFLYQSVLWCTDASVFVNWHFDFGAIRKTLDLGASLRGSHLG